jgi:hypothetical protein
VDVDSSWIKGADQRAKHANQSGKRARRLGWQEGIRAAVSATFVRSEIDGLLQAVEDGEVQQRVVDKLVDEHL